MSPWPQDALPLETLALTLHAADRCLVRTLDWQVRRGERWCVMGRNAVGKSTLLRALAGLAVPERRGEVHWFGRRHEDWMPADAARVRALAPQQPADRFPLTVTRQLELSRVHPAGRTAAAVLAALDAAALAERRVTELSGGERQRVALAQCVLQGAPLLLMDEPVSFQDPAHQMQVARWLATLEDAAVVLTAHDVNWAARAATHVLLLYGDGHWDAGPLHAMLQAARLERAYGCAWREIGGLWIAA